MENRNNLSANETELLELINTLSEKHDPATVFETAIDIMIAVQDRTHTDEERNAIIDNIWQKHFASPVNAV